VKLEHLTRLHCADPKQPPRAREKEGELAEQSSFGERAEHDARSGRNALCAALLEDVQPRTDAVGLADHVAGKINLQD